MNIEKERELFELWCVKDDEFCIHRYAGSDDYSDDCTQCAWMAWQASANREGYKLVPVEMSWQKADELASKEWDKNKSMFCVDNRDMSALQVEEFRLRWCKNKAYQIMSDYKAVIGATE